MNILNKQFIVDEKGNRTSVILSIEEYKKMAMIIVSAISSFPRKREPKSLRVDSRFRGNEVDVWWPNL